MVKGDRLKICSRSGSRVQLPFSALLIRGFMVKRIYIILLLGIFVVAGCIGTEKTLTMDDNGREVQVFTAGLDTLSVTLESQLSTGYSWSVAENGNNSIRQIGEPKIRQLTTVPGGKELQTFEFEVPSAGKFPLKLIYSRPWETNVPPLKTFTVTIIGINHG